MKIENLKYDIPTSTQEEVNFDIEKWRRDYPMDYLKAVYLINNAQDKNIAFQLIYKVIRMHVPDTLFKYYSFTHDLNLNEMKLDTLLKRKIYMSESKYLNDPFDNKAFYYDSKRLKKYKPLKPYNGKLIDDFSTFNRVTSLTENQTNSMPMWAHYSNNHNGYCVSYDMKNPSNKELCACTFPIQYMDQRIDITSVMEKQTEYLMNEIEIQSSMGHKEIVLNDLTLVFIQSLFCNIKHLSWNYEKEFRCSMGVNAVGMPYVTAFPKEIFVGLNCNTENTKKLKEIAMSLEIPIYQMMFNEKDENYNLTYTRI